MIQHFGLAAKSIKGKERLREMGFVVFDLEDVDRQGIITLNNLD